MQSAKQLGHRWFDEVWNRHRREAIAEMLAPDALLHDAGNDSVGREPFYEFFDRINDAFTDMHVDVQDTVAEGDRVCVRWLCTAKHTGEGLGFAATNRPISVSGMTVFRIEDGIFVEAWQNWDMRGLLEQIQGLGKAPTYIT